MRASQQGLPAARPSGSSSGYPRSRLSTCCGAELACPKAATPAGAGAGAAGAGAGAPGAGAGAAGAGAGAAGRGAQGGAGAGVGADPAKAAASGTVKVIDGNAIYVGLPDGTTKRVVSNESTRYTRTEPGSQRDVQPGDRVVVEGQPQPDGSVNATRVSDYASTLQQP